MKSKPIWTKFLEFYGRTRSNTRKRAKYIELIVKIKYIYDNMLEFIQELSHMNSPFTEHRVEHSKNSVGKRRQGHLWLTPGLFKIHCLQSNIFLFLKTFKSKYVFPFCLTLHLRPFWLSKVVGGKDGDVPLDRLWFSTISGSWVNGAIDKQDILPC